MTKSQIQSQVSLKSLNTFGVEAKAKFFYRVQHLTEIQNILQDSTFINMPFLILGGGSNLLLTQNFEGLALQIDIQGIEKIRETENCVFLRFGAGVNWHSAVLYTIKRGLGGLENLSLIPGTIGAAPIQNIGAYGVELKDVFESLEAVEITTGKCHTFTSSDCQFGYRNSIFKQELKGKFIITSVVLRLSKNPEFNISYGAIQSKLESYGKNISPKTISDAVIEIRESKLPDPAKIGNSGSFFKNPTIPNTQLESLKTQFPNIIGYSVSESETKIPAGWLIEQTGIKGKRFGNTGTYEKQALVLVNHGEATGKEILGFSKKVQQLVFEKFGIQLEREVNVI